MMRALNWKKYLFEKKWAKHPPKSQSLHKLNSSNICRSSDNWFLHVEKKWRERERERAVFKSTKVERDGVFECERGQASERGCVCKCEKGRESERERERETQ
jgi:hypothetical protein